MADLELQVGEVKTSTLSGKSADILCLSADYEFVVSGGGDFFTFGLESVTAQPLVNAEAGEYSVSVRCSIGPFSNEEITTFSITVLELPEVEEVTETTETTTTIDSIEIPVFRPPEE